MSTLFNLEIKTPEELIFSGEVEYLVVDHPSGKEGYLANHEYVLKPISGEIKYRTSPTSDYETLPCTRGWLAFLKDKALVFVGE